MSFSQPTIDEHFEGLSEYYDEYEDECDDECSDEYDDERNDEWLDDAREKWKDLKERIKNDQASGGRNKETLDEEEMELSSEIWEKEFERDIEHIREHESEYWAEEFIKRRNRIEELGKRQLEARIAAEAKGEDYLTTEKSAGRKMMELERAVDDAKHGMTPDKFGQVLDQYDEIKEYHENYHVYEDETEKMLGSRTYEENDENIDEAYADGRISREKRDYWKRRNRLHHRA